MFIPIYLPTRATEPRKEKGTHTHTHPPQIVPRLCHSIVEQATLAFRTLRSNCHICMYTSTYLSQPGERNSLSIYDSVSANKGSVPKIHLRLPTANTSTTACIVHHQVGNHTVRTPCSGPNRLAWRLTPSTPLSLLTSRSDKILYITTWIMI